MRSTLSVDRRDQLAQRREPSSVPSAFVHGLLKPALECLRRELLSSTTLRDAAPLARAIATATWTCCCWRPPSRSAAPSPATRSRACCRRSTTHLLCEFSALIMPERNLVVISTAEGRKVDTSVRHAHPPPAAVARAGAPRADHPQQRRRAAGRAAALPRALQSGAQPRRPRRWRARAVPRARAARIPRARRAARRPAWRAARPRSSRRASTRCPGC